MFCNRGLPIHPNLRYGSRMAEPYKCNVCDKIEEECDCTKYCCLCQGYHDVRLCSDGLWYCIDCREACDLQAQYKTVG